MIIIRDKKFSGQAQGTADSSLNVEKPLSMMSSPNNNVDNSDQDSRDFMSQADQALNKVKL